MSGEACIVCGWNKKRANGNTLVEGAHIKPFEAGNENDNYQNIVGMCPNHHTEFDAFNFYIDSKTLCLHFRESDEYEGLYVGDKILHVRTEYIAYNQYLYEENLKRKK